MAEIRTFHHHMETLMTDMAEARQPAGSPDAGTRSKPLARRTVLTTAAMTAASAALLGNAPISSTRAPEYFDISKAEVLAKSHRLHLSLDPTRKPRAVRIPLGTSRDETIDISVSSTTGRTGIITDPRDSAQQGKVSLRVAKDEPGAVWVVPRQVGPPLTPGDRLTVTTPHGITTMDVWIEPVAGQWRPAGRNGSALDLEIVAVHAALMRKDNGMEVVMWSPPRKRNPDGTPMKHPTRPGQWVWDIYNLEELESRVLDIAHLRTHDRPMQPHKMQIFCAGSAHLPNGKLLVVGGHISNKVGGKPDQHVAKHMHIYDPNASSGWRQLKEDTAAPARWYPGVTALPDGMMLITGGSRDIPVLDKKQDDSPTGYWNSINNNYDIFHPGKEEVVKRGERLIDTKMLPREVDRLATYPAVFVLPTADTSGTVIALAETNRAWLYTYDPSEEQPLLLAPRLYPMHTHGSRSYPTYGSMVLLPLEPGNSLMRVLAVGGQHEEHEDHRDFSDRQPSTATAEILYVDTAKSLTAQPGWQKAQSMHQARVLPDATLLADGKVLVSGGAGIGWGNQNHDPVLQAELFDPDGETFTAAATAATDRRYHATALLQPDGTVLKAGSTGGYDTFKGHDWMSVHTDAERYYPPYLWRGPRPCTPDIPGPATPTLHYGKKFTFITEGLGLDENARVALIRLGSTTHGSNMDQRYVWLAVAKRERIEARWSIVATPPANPAAAPPGDYLLVVVDSSGVPSPGKTVRVQAA
ncbi:glyoxal oxidase [Streptomyces gobiensis]|uniref:glyoxal oxidase n=1 Tax=Streptomyces gobiensis TaxID=2875706 RepID=UPI001E4658EE|nr:glyoxal oxidase [Streptomyces gobiensis]UGY93191.1 DUF1929 domain-containing protein [Streptomyces gobiensis]